MIHWLISTYTSICLSLSECKLTFHLKGLYAQDKMGECVIQHNREYVGNISNIVFRWCDLIKRDGINGIYKQNKNADYATTEV